MRQNFLCTEAQQRMLLMMEKSSIDPNTLSYHPILHAKGGEMAEQKQNTERSLKQKK
jgi:hypothetical protein